MLAKPYIAILCMLGAIFSYQISASLAKYLFTVLDPLTVTVLRLCFATIFVTLMFRSWRIAKQLPYLKWHDILCYSGSLCLMNLLFYYSLSKIPQGIAVGLEFIGPLAVAFLAVQQRRDYLWVLLAVIGIAGLVPWQQGSEFSYVGAGLALGAGVFWGTYIHFGQRIIQQNIGMHGLSLAIGISAFGLLPVGLWHDTSAVFAIEHWGHAMLIALLATAIPYALDLYALKYLNKMTYGTLTSLSPACAGLAGFLFFKETLTMWQMLGLLCIILASIGVTVFAKKS